MDKPVEQSGKLIPSLGLFTTITLVVGGVIGSGIFRNPSATADLLHSPWLLLAVWIGAGIITLFGALTNAEVAGIIPATGGQYQYFRAMYGEFMAFMYGWALFIVIQSGSIASITFVFAEYFNGMWSLWQLDPQTVNSLAINLPFGTLYPLKDIGIKILTFAGVGILTAINIIGVKQGGRVQAFFTVAKVSAILFLVAMAFISPAGSSTNLATPSANPVPVGNALMLALAMALNKVLWSYDGWNNITYVAGEVKNPQRNIPRALMVGTAICIGVYALINIAYLYVLPIDKLAASTSVARDAAMLMLGAGGAAFVSIAVMFSTIGTSNGTILASSRVYYAMARERLFFKSAGVINQKRNTPAAALIFQLVWTTVLIFSGSFDMLTDMLIFVSFGFYALGAVGVFILRKKMPNVERPYKTWGYPVIPIVFVLFSVAFLVYTINSDIENYSAGRVPIINSLWGIILLLTGVPFYLWFRRTRS